MGLLLDQRVVAIKKPKEMNQTEVKEFINEVSLLSRVDHRNVVKLYGCCLESEVPLLVYEFISNGTLSGHLNNWNRDSHLCWSDRRRIATEVAAAVAHLHIASSRSVIHRDLKSANILLDEKLTAKVSDFGASRAIITEDTHITTAVQGTFGYLDPEYYHTGKLTDKSDVYAFGVVLVELLTGEKPMPSTTSQLGEGNLTTRFILALKQNRLFQAIEAVILDEAEKEELEVFAWLAETCVRLRGEERPTMKEVEITLQGLRRSNQQKAWMNHDRNEGIPTHETSSACGGDSTTMQLNSKKSLPSSQTFLR